MAEEMAGRLDATAEQGRNAPAVEGNAAGQQPLVAVPQGHAAAAAGNAAGRQPMVAVAAGVAAAPVAVMAPINMAEQPGLALPRFDVEDAVAGAALPRKSNISCLIHARIDDGL